MTRPRIRKLLQWLGIQAPDLDAYEADLHRWLEELA